MVALKDVLTLFQKFHSVYILFSDKHQVLLARVQTIANMIERLPALANPALYRMFSSDPRMHVEIPNAQLKAVEATWEAARESLCGPDTSVAHKWRSFTFSITWSPRCRFEIQQLSRQLYRRDSELQTLIRRSNLSADALNKTLGANPSITAVANAVHQMYGMVHQQVNVEAVLLEKINYASSESELQATVAFFKGVVAAPAPQKSLHQNQHHHVPEDVHH